MDRAVRGQPRAAAAERARSASGSSGAGLMAEEPSAAWQLPQELVMLRDTVRRFMDAQVHPLEEKLDHDTVGLPREQLVEWQAKAGELGLWSRQPPEECGGAGLSVLGQVVVAEEAAKCRMGAFFPALGAFGGNPPNIMVQALS